MWSREPARATPRWVGNRPPEEIGEPQRLWEVEPSSWFGCHLPTLKILLPRIRIKPIFKIKGEEGEDGAWRAGSLSSAVHGKLGKEWQPLGWGQGEQVLPPGIATSPLRWE